MRNNHRIYENTEYKDLKNLKFLLHKKYQTHILTTEIKKN